MHQQDGFPAPPPDVRRTVLDPLGRRWRAAAMTLAVVGGGLALPLAGLGQTAGPPRFRAPVDYDTAGTIPVALTLGDVNGDGDPDLVVAGQRPAGSGADGRISVLLGDKAARFSGAATFPAGTRPLAAAVADVVPGAGLDIAVGDGGPDAGADGDAVSVLANQPGQAGGAAPGFAAPVPYGTGGAEPAAVAVADVDGDTRPDLVVANRLSDSVSVLKATAEGGFGPARLLATGHQPCGVVVGDLDGGGKPDIAVTEAGDGTVAVYRGEQDFDVATRARYPVGGRPCALAATDVDGDGHRDLVVADSAAGRLWVLAAGSDRTFAAPPAPHETGTDGVTALAVGDFNGDQDPDLAVVDGSHDSVSLLLGGDGAGFGTPEPVPFAATTGPSGTTATAGAAGLVAGDFDGDGDDDLAVAPAGTASPRVAVLVNNAVPTAVDDRWVIDEDTQLHGDVLGNDSPPEPGETLEARVARTPAHGILDWGTDGSFDYRPAHNYFGEDSFTYTVTDDGGATSAPATVTIKIDPVNDPPVANADSAVTQEDTPADVPVTGNDTDPDPGDVLQVVDVKPIDGGSVTCGTQRCRFVPGPDYSGPAHFQYFIADGNGGAASAVATVMVTPVPDPPVANDDAQTTPEDTPQTIEVTANDRDPGDTFKVTAWSQPKALGGSVFCSDTSCTYTPLGNVNGTDTFTYTITDSTGRTATATVTMTITPQNEAPVAADDTYPDRGADRAGATEDRTFVVPARQGVLANDTDGDRDPLEAHLIAGTTRGELNLQPDGSFTYTPAPDFSGTDSFSYQASDAKADSDPVTVTLNVAAVDDPPVVPRPDAITTVEGKAVPITVVASDVDDDDLKVTVSQPPVHGRASCRENICTYRPRPHYIGDDSFAYTVTDPHGGATSATQDITVFPAGPRGYWLLGAEGSLYSFGSAPDFGDPPASMDGARAVDLEPSPSGNGYWVLDDRGRVHPFGDAAAYGSVDPFTLGTGDEARAMVLTASGAGYWVVTAAGRVFPFGDAAALGDLTDRPPPAPIVGAASTPDGGGYYLVGSDGGVYAFGTATDSGSLAGQPLNAPIMSIAADADGRGYWLAATDGGVFAFDAPFRGSMGSVPLNGPVRGIRTYGRGYLLVAEDGGVFVFSDRPFHGSLGAAPPARPITSGVIF